MNQGALKLFQHFAPSSPDGLAAAKNLVLGTVPADDETERILRAL